MNKIMVLKWSRMKQEIPMRRRRFHPDRQSLVAFLPGNLSQRQEQGIVWVRGRGLRTAALILSYRYVSVVLCLF